MHGSDATMRPAKVSVIGTGTCGTALAMSASRGDDASGIWAREPEVARGIEVQHRNPLYLSDFELSHNVHASTALDEAVDGAFFILVVVPSHAVRQVIRRFKHAIGKDTILVSATKGVENETLM